jgi:hypothetical protein
MKKDIQAIKELFRFLHGGYLSGKPMCRRVPEIPTGPEHITPSLAKATGACFLFSNQKLDASHASMLPCSGSEINRSIPSDP